MGINYYTRNIVEFVFQPSNYFHRCRCDQNLEKSDLGWDIYPQGIYRVSKEYFLRYKIPIYITENGLSDRDDSRRGKFIKDHLVHIAQAIKEGVEIDRYYHWSVMDNFEWLEGESAAFGLYHCNFSSQERTARKSALEYAQICLDKSV